LFCFCQVTCGDGFQYRTATCTHQIDGSTDPSHCVGMPSITSQPCMMSPCVSTCSSTATDNGHYTFNNENQLLYSTVPLNLNNDLSWSMWIRRSSIGKDMFALNVGKQIRRQFK
jgi:hypothetical protein